MPHDTQHVYTYSLYQKYMARWPELDREILLMLCRLVAYRVNRRALAPLLGE